MNQMDSESVVIKKRGRKPKIKLESNSTPGVIDYTVTEKKKRGRKKKYEIENSVKMLNRDHLNNFNHHVAYSDDEDKSCIDDIRNISFGNLAIKISKKQNIEDSIDDYRNNIILQTKKENKGCEINENEYSNEEEIIPIEQIINVNNTEEKVFEERKNYTRDYNDNITKSFKRLRIITTIKDIITDSVWPEKTDLHCWWCCHKFDTSPCTLPTNYDSYKKKYTFVGVFCSWNCTKSYNIEKNDYKKAERSGLITLLVKQLYGMSESILIKSAPPRQCLKMFGGYMDISEFRDNFSYVDAYSMNLMSYKYNYPEITEITNIKLKNRNNRLRLVRNM